MLAARAAHGDRQVALSFADVRREQKFEHGLKSVHEVLGEWIGEDKITHFGVETRQGSQCLVPIGVRQEPHIEHEIDIEG